MEHATWNGLYVADLVFPWFIWIMGVCIPMSVRSAIKKETPVRSVAINTLKLMDLWLNWQVCAVAGNPQVSQALATWLHSQHPGRLAGPGETEGARGAPEVRSLLLRCLHCRIQLHQSQPLLYHWIPPSFSGRHGKLYKKIIFCSFLFPYFHIYHPRPLKVLISRKLSTSYRSG